MRKVTVLLVSLLGVGLLTSSFSAENFSKTRQVKGEGHEKVSEKLFIPDAFFDRYNLQADTRANPRIHDWSSMDESNKFAVVNDIRWEFDNADEAMAYQKANLSVNSQRGVELHPNLNIPGVSELHVYKESESIAKLNNDMGINTMEYGYLFVIDNVVVKVWVKVNGNISVEEASLFAREAAKSIQAAKAK